MKKEQLETIISKIQSVRIAVVGDFCLDAYWFIDESKSEVSVETGQPTMPVREQRYSLGGAGNVANNLTAMGISDVRAFGVIGTDPFGSEMVRLMKENGIETEAMIIQEKDWSTHVYAKPFLEDAEQSRIDFGNFNRLSEETAGRLISNLKSAVPELDLVIINQQVLSGIHTEYFRVGLVDLISEFPDKIFIADSRNFCDYYEGAYRKMNDTEAAVLCGMKRYPDDNVSYTDVMEAAKRLSHKYKKPIFITRGERGSLIVDQDGISEIYGLMIISQLDTVGAGDSYLSGAAAALAAGFDMKVAGEIGNYVAGVTVQKLFQTGTAGPDEIIKIGTDPDLLYNPELAEDMRHAVYLKNSDIEIIREWPRNIKITHAIFDHDGTVSTLREGWEQIMAPLMMKAILGSLYEDADDVLYQKVYERVVDFIDKTTGIQTLVQMKGLTDLVREFGLVPENEILDEFGYKEIYNKELLQMARGREEKFLRGELGIEDYTLKNSVLFVKTLYNAGIRLYLASGTDEEDVKNEAGVLGYDKYFEGGIYGSVGDINKEAKKIVLDRILGDIGEDNIKQVVTFGDGPVEIRETRKRGGLTVGVASNEVKRHGLNESKRSRLIKAGADVIVPDFSQMQILLELLNINQ